MASTAETLLGHAWNFLRTDGNSTDIPALQEAFMLTLLSQANMEWARAHRRGGGAEPLVFLRETGFDLIADTAIADTTTTVGDTEFVVDKSDDFDASDGALVVWDANMPDICQYTTNTVATETFSGVTGLAFVHEDGDTVQSLYKLPTTFNKFRPSDGYGDGVLLNGNPLRFMQGPPEAGYFSMYDDGTSKWLWLQRAATGSASVLFEKKSATINSTDDIVDVPEESEFFLVWRVVQMASIPKEGQPTQLYLTAKSEANKILQESLTDRNVGKIVRVRQFLPYRPQRDASFFTHVAR